MTTPTAAPTACECPEQRACGLCDGEGYRYLEQAGRHATHPIVELRCERCGGTGLETP